MANNYPETIPAAYASEKLADAYKQGWNRGHGIACHNVPTLGTKLFVEDMGHVTVDAENIREVHQSFCNSAESNSRQYSPFEFIAHEFNSADRDSQVEGVDDGTFDVVADDGETLESGFKTEELAQEWIAAQPSSEELWEAFEAGTNDAIQADLSEYTDENYGIEPESEVDE